MGDNNGNEHSGTATPSDPLSKFREIKEKRFQPKDKSKRGYFNTHVTSETDAQPNETEEHRNKTETKTSGTHRAEPPTILLDSVQVTIQDTEDRDKGVGAPDGDHLKPPGVNTKRRVSMPSIFHPLQPLATNHKDSTDSLDDSTPGDDGLYVPTQSRRASMPILLQAYATGTVQEPDKMDGPSSDDTAIQRSGQAANTLHAFYNLWECSDNKNPRSRSPKH